MRRLLITKKFSDEILKVMEIQGKRKKGMIVFIFERPERTEVKKKVVLR